MVHIASRCTVYWIHNFADDSEKCKFHALSQTAWDIIAMAEIYGLLTDKCMADTDM